MHSLMILQIFSLKKRFRAQRALIVPDPVMDVLNVLIQSLFVGRSPFHALCATQRASVRLLDVMHIVHVTPPLNVRLKGRIASALWTRHQIIPRLFAAFLVLPSPMRLEKGFLAFPADIVGLFVVDLPAMTVQISRFGVGFVAFIALKRPLISVLFERVILECHPRNK